MPTDTQIENTTKRDVAVALRGAFTEAQDSVPMRELERALSIGDIAAAARLTTAALVGAVSDEKEST